MANYDDLGLVYSDQPQQTTNNYGDLGLVYADKPATKKNPENYKDRFWAGIDVWNASNQRLPMGILQLLHLKDPKEAKDVIDAGEAALSRAKEKYPKMAGALEVAGGVNSSTPLMAIPGLGQSALARGVTQGAIQNGLMGFGQYAEGNNPLLRAMRGVVGAGIGAAMPLLSHGATAIQNPLVRIPASAALGAGIGGAGAAMVGANPIAGMMAGGLTGAGIPAIKTGYNYFFPKNQVIQDVINTVDDIPHMLDTKKAGQRIGIDLTPAEASGSPVLGKMQGDLGRSQTGAKLLQQFGNKHIDQQKAAIGSFLDDASTNTESAATGLRSTAQKVIKGQTEELRAQAKPFYEASYKTEVDPSKIKFLMQDDPNIDTAVKQVVSDKRFARENRGYPQNSIRILDQAKRRIDAGIQQAIRDGDDHLKGVLLESKNRLIKETDSFSPDYANARSIYGEGAKPLEAIKNSQIGKFADYSDQSVENIVRDAFNPDKYSAKSFVKMRDSISNENPDIWNQGVRNFMERSLDKTTGKGTGIGFYQKLLKSDRQYNLLYAAVEKIPGAQGKLQDMRATFNNLINPRTPRAEAALSNTGMTGRRYDWAAVKDFANKFLGGRYDKAAVEFITNPKWDQELTEFMKKPASNYLEKSLKYQGILSKIQTSIATRPNGGK
jgi:hypothetical protein